MSKKMVILAFVALDECSKLKDLQELLEIATDQLEGNDKRTLRLKLLIGSYLSRAELRLNDLNAALNEIRQQLRDEYN